jgi:hypothetical protein
MNQPDIEEDETETWQSIGALTGKLIVAWDHVEAREHASLIADYTDDRQGAYLLEALWTRKSTEWRQRALGWLRKFYEAGKG